MLNKPYFTRRNRVSLVCNGQEFIDTCCKVIGEAQQKILFHTYAFEVDEVTQPFIDAILQKARQGVHIFIIIDAFGSGEIPSSLKQQFNQRNIHFCYFAPFFSKRLENVGRRLHQKVLVVDNNQALVGGINHGQRYINPAKSNPWLDYAVLLQGEEVFRLQCKIKRLYAKYFPDQWPLLKSLIKREANLPQSSVLARSNVNDFMRFKSEIYRSHLRAIRLAKRKIQLFATYFLPGKKLLRELKRAIRRGVKVELIFSAFSDHPAERWSSKYLYNWYLKNKIVLYEWDKSIVHGKVLVIDDEWVSIGSYNHNYISRYINLEMNIEIMDKPFASIIAREVAQIKSQCREINKQSWQKDTTIFQSALYFCTYMLANIMSLISTIIIIRRKDRKLSE